MYINRSMDKENMVYIYTTDFFGFVCFCFLGLHLQHVEVPRLVVELELQLLACATATQDLSHFCNLHHSTQAMLNS